MTLHLHFFVIYIYCSSGFYIKVMAGFIDSIIIIIKFPVEWVFSNKALLREEFNFVNCMDR